MQGLEDVDPNRSRVQEVEQWTRKLQDIGRRAALDAMDPAPLHFSLNSQVYKFKDKQKVCKFTASQHELDLLLDAGDCTIEVLARVVWKYQEKIWMDGIIFPLATPLKPKDINPSQHRALMDQMISLVSRLHTKKIIHGDIKPPNFLLCSGDQLRLCDFSEGLRFDEDLSNWNGMTTINYISPHRTRLWPGSASESLPTIEDDLYGLGVSIWELYTGKVPFDSWYEDDILWVLQQGETVDVNEIKDEEVKAVICEYLRIGGAKV
ncbi:hypothetical protein LOZ58_004112 [Ophidiomyces ophidiicola]|nr:hypothetical protein LOZ58_004112 [Ophidiomyces ophidiicola]